MGQTEIGIIGCVLLVALILMGTHIGFAMIIVGIIGFGMIGGWSPALGVAGILPFDKMYNYDFSVLPLFLLMGHLFLRVVLEDRHMRRPVPGSDNSRVAWPWLRLAPAVSLLPPAAAVWLVHW
jgi:hypothetical protein